MKNPARQISEVVYMWLENDSYGSEFKAIQALVKRRGMQGVNKDRIKSEFQTTKEIFLEAKNLVIQTAMELGGKPPYLQWQFEESKIARGTELIRSQLIEKFPNFDLTVQTN